MNFLVPDTWVVSRNLEGPDAEVGQLVVLGVCGVCGVRKASWGWGGDLRGVESSPCCGSFSLPISHEGGRTVVPFHR